VFTIARAVKKSPAYDFADESDDLIDDETDFVELVLLNDDNELKLSSLRRTRFFLVDTPVTVRDNIDGRGSEPIGSIVDIGQ